MSKQLIIKALEFKFDRESISIKNYSKFRNSQQYYLITQDTN